MNYATPEAIEAARRIDLYTYLHEREPQELVKCGNGVYCTRTHDRLKGQGIVCRRLRVGIAEIDFILSGSFLMVRAFGPDAHALQCEADLPAHILSLVFRRHIHIAGPVVRNFCLFALLILLEKVKLHL